MSFIPISSLREDELSLLAAVEEAGGEEDHGDQEG
jgi:hypothetical protein